MTRDPTNFREYAGTLISVIVISAYLALGFVHMTISVIHGTPPAILADWNTTMQSLANIALGYLIGKQTVGPSNGNGSGTLNVPVDPAQVTATVTTTTEAKKP